MRFENDELSELCRAHAPGLIVGVDGTPATVDDDAAPTAGDAGGGSGE